MNCPYCDAPTDYRFSTRCSYCESDLSTPTESPDSLTTLPPAKSKRTAFERVADGLTILLSSSLCTVAGAVVMYFVGAFVYLTFFATNGPHSCSEGAAAMSLSILTGAFLGCIGGTIIGYQVRFEARR